MRARLPCPTTASACPGMSLIQNLGTIARSGTAEFLQQMTGDEKKDAKLIGQFGVGFYSAFIVADRVEVLTRKAGLDSGDAVRWESDGQGEFTIEVRRQRRTGHYRNAASEG